VRILVVDDDPAVRRSIDRALRLEGYDVVTVPSGGEALEALAQAPPDALILDLGLPDLDGLTVCRRMRSAGDDTPVLMLTARDAVDDRVQGLDAGADDYLVKPYALAELRPVCTPEEWRTAQKATEAVPVHEAVAAYAVALCRASRTAPGVHLGASPRAAIWLIRAAQAHAVLHARSYVVPDDVKAASDKVVAGWKDGSYDVFTGEIKDQTGAVKVAKGERLADDKLATIDWYVQGVQS